MRTAREIKFSYEFFNLRVSGCLLYINQNMIHDLTVHKLKLFMHNLYQLELASKCHYFIIMQIIHTIK